MSKQAMNTKRIVLLSSALALAAAMNLHAGTRRSVSFIILTDTADEGGRHTSSATYTNDGSIGGIAGVSIVTAPAEKVKSGFVGQLYEVAGLVLNAAPTTLNEGGTLQLGAAQLLDDATTLALDASSITWSVAAGPLTSIDASGLATAGIVYQDTAATAQGNYLSYSSTLSLTVLNVNADDFGTYAGDGIDDAWQTLYFGAPPNPNAGPNVDFDGTGQTNLFKFIAGLNPLDPNSRFVLKIAAVPGQPGRKNLIFTPRLSDRTYSVTTKSSLLTAGAWNPILSFLQSDNGTERTVTDLNAIGPAKFYRVEITKP